jgi:hypothetical protein
MVLWNGPRERNSESRHTPKSGVCHHTSTLYSTPNGLPEIHLKEKIGPCHSHNMHPCKAAVGCESGRGRARERGLVTEEKLTFPAILVLGGSKCV